MTTSEQPILGGEVVILPDSEVGNKVRLQAGRYAGVELRYGKVSFQERAETIKISFDYEILDRAGHSQLRTDRKFKSLISDLLRYLIVLESCQGDTKEIDSDWWDFTIASY